MVKIEVVSFKSNSLKLKIHGEDFTLGNIIQEALLKDKRVKGVGVVKMHPFDDFIVIQIFFDADDPIKMVSERLSQVEKELVEIREEIKKELEKK